MDGSVRILIGGLLAGLIVFAAGYAGSIRNDTHLSDLVRQCESENTRPSLPPTDPLYTAQLVCDPAKLRELSPGSDLVGVQAKIVQAQSKREAWFKWTLAFSVGLILLSGTPYTWYFLLRRIREFAEAIRGKHPDA